jgi:hypothetical protein
MCNNKLPSIPISSGFSLLLAEEEFNWGDEYARILSMLCPQLIKFQEGDL